MQHRAPGEANFSMPRRPRTARRSCRAICRSAKCGEETTAPEALSALSAAALNDAAFAQTRPFLLYGLTQEAAGQRSDEAGLSASASFAECCSVGRGRADRQNDDGDCGRKQNQSTKRENAEHVLLGKTALSSRMPGEDLRRLDGAPRLLGKPECLESLEALCRRLESC